MESKPRLSRLTSIITQLQSKRLVTASSLAQKYGVSVRTIYRDMRMLEQSGIPIITVEGKGYSLMDGYQLPPILFSEEEANALITAERLVLKNMDQSFVDHYSNAITKIKAVMRTTQKENAELLENRVYFGGNNSQERSSSNLMQIQSAIVNFKLVKIVYHSSQKEQTTREVEPFAIYSVNGNFVLIAFCRLRHNFRVFRIDYIESLVELSECFEPHKLTLEEYFERYVNNQ